MSAMMKKSESGQDLLNLPYNTVPFKMEEFVVTGIGGGFILVNTYGDFVVTVGHVDMGILGEDWADTEAAIDSLTMTANATSEKCIASDLKVGGCAIVLYLNSKEVAEAHPDAAVRLLEALAEELTKFIQTNIVTYAGYGVRTEDLIHLHRATEQLRDESGKLGDGGGGGGAAAAATTLQDEKKSDSSAMDGKLRSHVRGSEDFQFPVPSALISPDAIRDKVVEKAAAYSAYGAVCTLLKAKEWMQTTGIKIVLCGATPVSCELYWLLTQKSNHVLITDSRESAFDNVKIPSTARIPWEKVFDSEWDVLLFCTATLPTPREDSHRPHVDEAIVSNLHCKAVLSLTDNLMPSDVEERERFLMALEKKGMFEFVDGLCDVGAIVCLYHYSHVKSPKLVFSHEACYKLGCNVMSKKLHLDGIVRQYDTEDRRKFYRVILNNHLADIGGLHLGLGTMIHSSSDRMTEWMWNRARSMCPAYRALQGPASSSGSGSSGSSSSGKQEEKETFGVKQSFGIHYLDLGAGTGSAARWISKQDTRIHVKCINICPKQNAENRHLSDEEGLGGQISVETATFECLCSEYSNLFDGCISQDSFIHAFNKSHAFSEAFRVTKGGGWLMVSDLMRGETLSSADHDVKAEIEAFAEKHHVNITNWTTPAECVALAKKAGWSEVQFFDYTAEIKVSLQGLLNKVKSIIDSGTYKGLNLKLLQTHRLSLSSRIGQVDRGVFKWGIIAARKPYDVVFLSNPPVVPDPHPMMSYSTNYLDGTLKFGTDVIVLNIKDKMPREKIMELPITTRLIVTMSAGLDHICVEAAEERGIRIRRAARDQIVKSVADYLLSNIIFGLRNGFQNVGVPFPGASWDLSWNAKGVDLDCSKVGFIGMGAIAMETARRIRALSSDCELVYHVPEGIRCHAEEGLHNMRHVGIADLVSTCDVVIPMVPLTPKTAGLISYSSFAMMKNSAIFINMARGKVVDTDGMLRALQEKQVLHAILDTTDPEPLPESHPLWKLKNCTITPHFATNTTYVRKELVEDISNQVEDTLDERGILRLEEQRLRKELSDAYRITREFGMDELVWNHISVQLSDASILITPGCRMFDDVGPQDLVKSSGNVTGDIIHQAIYNHRTDVKAVVHLHTPATVAVSCLVMGFVPLAQEAAPFVGRVARYAWQGLSNDWEEEEAMIGDAVKDPNCNTLLMENHGFCTLGKTLGEAWVLAYYFDKACQTQLNCLQTGAKINYPNERILRHAEQQYRLPEFLPGACEWEALRKMLTRKQARR